jgi:phenylalanyl-tRNA synthetase beta chain
VVCGAHNFAVGDLVVVSLPGAVLAGGFAIAARKTYGHVSDGMICAEDELGIGSDHTGIIVLPARDDAGRDLQPGDDPADVLHLRDDVLDIDVSPDIGYCLSIRGLAREAGQSLGVRFTDVVDRPTPPATSDGYPVRLEDPACPLFVALGVSGIDPSRPTPRWMARRLAMAGMRSISLAVDITNYVMLETGQPLHAYDASLLRGPIVVRKAAPGETLVTLDDVRRTLDAADLLITDDSGPIGLAGVMGGQSTELRNTTTDVVVEAASFDPVTISRTLRRHNLPSEASKRFHRGVDPDAAYSAAHLAARLLVELAGGTLDPAETVAGGVPAMPSQLIDADLPSRILGLEVPQDTVVDILRASGVSVTVVEREGTSGPRLTLVPPTWRPDLVDPYDYVEEVGRKIGFDQLPSVVPTAPVGRGLTRRQRARRAIGTRRGPQAFAGAPREPARGDRALPAHLHPAGPVRRRRTQHLPRQ